MAMTKKRNSGFECFRRLDSRENMGWEISYASRQLSLTHVFFAVVVVLSIHSDPVVMILALAEDAFEFRRKRPYELCSRSKRAGEHWSIVREIGMRPALKRRGAGRSFFFTVPVDFPVLIHVGVVPETLDFRRR